MKRLIGMLLTLVLVVSLAGCDAIDSLLSVFGVEQTPFAVYERTLQASEDATSAQMDMDIKMDVDMGGMTMGINMDCAVATVTKGDGDFDMRMDIGMSLFGQDMSYTAFITDGYMYVDMMGQKIKAPYTQNGAIGLGSEPLVFTEDMVQDATIETLEGGDRRLVFTFGPEEVDKLLGGVADGLTGDLSAGELSVGALTYTMLVDKSHTLKSAEMSVEMDADVMGQMIGMTMIIMMDNIVYNAIDAIELPADLGAYVEDADSIGSIMPF